MPFTPTTPINTTVIRASTEQTSTARIVEFTMRLPFGLHPSMCVVVEKVRSDGVVLETLSWTISDKDGDTPVATAWAVAVTNGKTRYDEIKDAIYALLQAQTNPATGAPFLPAGTVS